MPVYVETACTIKTYVDSIQTHRMTLSDDCKSYDWLMLVAIGGNSPIPSEINVDHGNIIYQKTSSTVFAYTNKYGIASEPTYAIFLVVQISNNTTYIDFIYDKDGAEYSIDIYGI